MLIKNLYYLIFRGLDKIAFWGYGGYAYTRDQMLTSFTLIIFNMPIIVILSVKLPKYIKFNNLSLGITIIVIFLYFYILNWYLFIKKKQKYLDYLKEYSSYSRSKKLLYGVMAFILALFLSIVPYFYF